MAVALRAAGSRGTTTCGIPSGTDADDTRPSTSASFPKGDAVRSPVAEQSVDMFRRASVRKPRASVAE